MRRHLFIIGTIILIILALGDWLMKRYVITHIVANDVHRLFPCIDLTFHKNLGITFNIPIPLWIIIPVTGFIILWLMHRGITTARRPSMITLGYISIIAGATNNLLDRIIHGWTTDYVMLFNTSIINGSDILIILGATIIIGSTHAYQRSSKNRE